MMQATSICRRRGGASGEFGETCHFVKWFTHGDHADVARCSKEQMDLYRGLNHGRASGDVGYLAAGPAGPEFVSSGDYVVTNSSGKEQAFSPHQFLINFTTG